MTCSKSKESIRAGPGQSPHRADPQHGVLITASHGPGEHLYPAPFCFSRSPAVSGGAVLAAFCDRLPRFLLFPCSLNTLRENMYLFSSFCICFSTSFNSASVVPAVICEGLSSSQHLKYLCITQRAMQNSSIEIQNPTRLTSFQNKTKSQAMEFLFKPFFYIFLFLYRNIFPVDIL